MFLWMMHQVNLDLISYFKEKGEYKYYEKELCWRLLNAKQELCFYRDSFGTFMLIFTKSHQYILSCPFLSMKVVVFDSSLRFISEMLSFCRKLKIIYSCFYEYLIRNRYVFH